MPETIRNRRALVGLLAAALTSAVIPMTWGAGSADAVTTLSTVQVNRYDALLHAVNKARATGRHCGGTWYRAAPPLRRSMRLTMSATAHARDMAVHNYFSHVSRAGSTPTSRARVHHYYRGVGENIAAGFPRVSMVMRAWLRSPGHCANIMSRRYRDIGFGYSHVTGSTYGAYWVQDFGLKP